MSHRSGNCILALVPILANSATAAAQSSLPSPVRPIGPAGDGITMVDLDIRAYAAAKFTDQTIFTDFPLSTTRSIDLDLVRFDAFSPDAIIVEAGKGGEIPLPRPELVLLRGSVRDHPGSAVFLGLSPTAMSGYVIIDGHTHILASPPAGSQLPAVIYDLGIVPESRLKITNPPCGSDNLVQPPAPRPGAGGSGGADHYACRVVRVAVETDYEYTSGVFGGNNTNSLAYPATLLGAITEIYLRDFNAALTITYLRIWRDNTDPYSSTTVEGRLDEVKNYWNANMGSVSRNLTHMLTGIAAGAGGVAYGGVVCPGPYSYGASGHLEGHFPYPLLNHNGQNWDLMVVGHEIGHNFNAPHTHSMTPPIDGCGSNPSDCSAAFQGTIMSYCHGCPGGMTNILLQFHPRTIVETVLPYLSGPASACAVETAFATIAAQPQPVTTLLGEDAAFTVATAGDGPFFFQWKKNGVNLVDGPHFSGTRTSTLAISNIVASDTGTYTVVVSNPCAGTTSTGAPLTIGCYANCDESATQPILNANDFQCFLNSFASGQTYANCDLSTAAPILNANDFQCFLNAFASGCP